MLRRYRFAFEPWGLLLFGLMMAPSLVWSVYPAPQDVLRTASETPMLDMFASVAQMAAVAALCLLRHEERPGSVRSRLCVASAVSLAGYWLGWGLYYAGVTAPAVILMLTLLPCASLLSFAADRRNGPALVFGGVFACCHAAHAIINFIL